MKSVESGVRVNHITLVRLILKEIEEPGIFIV